jgi:acetoin utilization deacetylase AcuC-like enzyme
MKVVFADEFYQTYTADPAAAAGRMEAVMDKVGPHAELVEARPAPAEALLRTHHQSHLAMVGGQGLYEIAALAAGATIQAAEIGLAEPAFALVRPPGHHASAADSWGFCYFNNLAVALLELRARGEIASAYVLDIDLHYGDGTVDILGGRDWVRVHNVEAREREAYLAEVAAELEACRTDIIAVSAGFDLHRDDWGGRLATEDYHEIGRLCGRAAAGRGAGLFAALEGGYNHQVLGDNVLALIRGMAAGWAEGKRPAPA